MEIVVVGIGVLLALSVQQWADGRASRQRATAAEIRIREELETNVGPLLERLAIFPCLRERLLELGRGVTGGGPRWRPAILAMPNERLAFHRVYRVPGSPLFSDAFRGATATGELNAASIYRVSEISNIYVQLAKLQSIATEESRLATRLGILQFSGPRTAAERGAVLETLLQLDDVNELSNSVARQTMKSMIDLGYTPSGESKGYLRRSGWWPATVAALRQTYGQCVDPFAITVVSPEFRDQAILARSAGERQQHDGELQRP